MLLYTVVFTLSLMGGGLERLRRLGGENEDDGYVDHVGNNDGGGRDDADGDNSDKVMRLKNIKYTSRLVGVILVLSGLVPL